MHEWLEALRKSAKATSEGVQAEEVRRAETECGVPFPEDLADLYQALNGGEFQGEVRLYPLRGDEGAPSVLEKSRLMVVGLPAAGVWRFGLKGAHRHLFVARKSAMEEQGDGGGPLPGWVEAMDGDDWVFGTWDGEKKEMRLYRTLKDMLEVLIPPVEEVESFGERTFARAMNAVLQGALSGAAAESAAEDEEAPSGRGRDYTSDLAALAREAAEADDESEVSSEEELEAEVAEDAGEELEAAEQGELFEEPGSKRPAAKKAPSKPARKGAVGKAAAKKGAAVKGATAKKSAAKKGSPAKKSAAKGAAAKKGAVAKKGAAKGAAQKRGTASKGAAAKKGATAKKGAIKKGAAAKKGAAQKRGATAKKATGKAAAKKSSRRS
ncbi:SMI1/KNR4 family protein [Corallococcus macrosporus]|uniref:SMI1/KNR4 family protein n=1 Tax=Corallococcus macrosporus TaxID=35 RepID=A0ABS3DHA7_9BACT|nr:SMI1/KNR4 family protein [Corallococcus macrosporus]MBN8230722.1 SMI1/KNR4 family protein [Corallococcus macrosporus]